MSNSLVKLDRPSQVFDAIKSVIRAALDAGDGDSFTVGGCEDWGEEEASGRDVLIEFGEMRPAAKENDGRDSQRQEIILYAVLSAGNKGAALAACNLASGLARLADCNRWGLSGLVIDEPENISAQAVSFRKGREHALSFEAWEVRFYQVIKYGDSEWPEDPGQDAPFALAINPADEDADSSYTDIDRA